MLIYFNNNSEFKDHTKCTTQEILKEIERLRAKYRSIKQNVYSTAFDYDGLRFIQRDIDFLQYYLENRNK